MFKPMTIFGVICITIFMAWLIYTDTLGLNEIETKFYVGFVGAGIFGLFAIVSKLYIDNWYNKYK